MAIDDIIDSVKEWFSNRLKNPYFASVLFAWLIINRIEVFGLFNFNEDQTVQDRVLWMQQQFSQKEYSPFWGLFVLRGFWGSTIFAVMWGFVAMIIFKFLKVTSGIIYNFFDKGFIRLQKWDKPSEWKPIKDFIAMEEKHKLDIDTLEKNKIDLVRRTQESEGESKKMKEERDIAVNTNAGLRNDKLTMQTQLNNLGTEIQQLLKENRELKENTNNLSVTATELAKAEMDRIKSNPNDVFGNIDKGNYISLTDRINESNELQAFLKSEYVKSFESIMSQVMSHKPISPTVPEYIRDFYLANGLIGIKENHYTITTKGEKYYIEYLKVKEHK